MTRATSSKLLCLDPVVQSTRETTADLPDNPSGAGKLNGRGNDDGHGNELSGGAGSNAATRGGGVKDLVFVRGLRRSLSSPPRLQGRRWCRASAGDGRSEPCAC